VINRLIYQLESRADWFSLGRLYVRLEQPQNATRATCRGVINAIENGNLFSAAFYLKEMLEETMLESLFIASLKQASDRGDLWWQYRALQELEWHSEAREFLLENQEEIEASEEPHFIEQLTVATDDKHRYVELRKEEALSISAKKGAEYPAWVQQDEANSDLSRDTPGLNNNQE
jgi:cytochrome c biogenesis protein ResB